MGIYLNFSSFSKGANVQVHYIQVISRNFTSICIYKIIKISKWLGITSLFLLHLILAPSLSNLYRVPTKITTQKHCTFHPSIQNNVPHFPSKYFAQFYYNDHIILLAHHKPASSRQDKSMIWNIIPSLFALLNYLSPINENNLLEKTRARSAISNSIWVLFVRGPPLPIRGILLAMSIVRLAHDFLVSTSSVVLE